MADYGICENIVTLQLFFVGIGERIYEILLVTQICVVNDWCGCSGKLKFQNRVHVFLKKIVVFESYYQGCQNDQENYFKLAAKYKNHAIVFGFFLVQTGRLSYQ